MSYGTARFLIALGIVIASVSTAVGAWRAEIFMEYAGQKEGLFRQALSGQQLSERIDEETVAAGIRQFGNYERHLLAARRLQDAANRATGIAAQTLALEARADGDLANLTLASSQGVLPLANFPPTSPAATLPRNRTEGRRSLAGPGLPGAPRVLPSAGAKGTVTYDPAADYRAIVLPDFNFATFDPADLAADAETARRDAVDMAVVAVLFAVAVALLTGAEIALRRRRPAPAPKRTLGHWLAYAATVCWLAGGFWFLNLLADIPRLR